ncbi:lysylphosphatidylglycerol synthase transmembrane domain-containing protein [Acaryochloris sp. IP29b_bin.148]|uniref:lysylphosphatidylglycerol synthase transmembrane domain-containing protein n=1 Tax=Acaryochloris sp. IP29b_bin.148 TaxID=2969218 RepID=UPI00261B4822|nr:lysylphosphatidylglycerol synthase transmembrane domain-containing protein [Acaryochloris sp. IP29b_bin.148]
MKKFGKKKTFVRLLVLFCMGLGLVFLFQKINLQGRDLLDAFQRFSLESLLLMLGVTLVQMAFQVTRLWVLCPRAAGVSWAQAANTYISGQFIGNFVLSQAGHAVKIALLRKEKDTKGRKIDAAEATAVILVDKVLDVGILVTLAVLSALQVSVGLPQVDWWEKGIILLIGVPFLGVALWALLQRLRQRFPKLRQWFRKFKAGLAVIRNPIQIRNAAVMDLGDWFTECLLLQMLCMAQGHVLSLPQLLICLFILNLGLTVPTTMANLGTYEAALAFSLNGMGVPLAPSVVIATMFHAYQLFGLPVWMLGQKLGPNVSPKLDSALPIPIPQERPKVTSK